MRRKLISNKLFNFILVACYCIFYNFIYVNYICRVFLYMWGVPDSHITTFLLIKFIIISSLPVLFYKGFENIASGISLFVYIFLYIPIIYTTCILPSQYNTSFLSVVLFFMMCLFFLTDHLNIYIGSKVHKKIIPFKIIEIITIIMMVFIILLEGSHLKFVNILTQKTELYNLRETYGNSRHVVTGYLLSWCKYALLPLLLVYYLKTKKWIKYSVSICAFLVIFMFDMLKVSFIMPFLLTGIFFIIKNKDITNKLLPYVFLIFIIVPYALFHFIANPTIYSIAAIVIMRTQCIETWLASIYINFFSTHQFTYYTHINIINFLSGGAYPYSDVLGRAVTEGGMNANASFLLTDGYAAIGVIGVIIASILFILFKSIINGVSIGYNKNLVILFMISAITALLNVSLFTAILSCGFLIFYVCLKYVDLSEFEE